MHAALAYRIKLLSFYIKFCPMSDSLQDFIVAFTKLALFGEQVLPAS